MRNHVNNFNILRLAFAVGVVLSHSFALVGAAEPLVWGRPLGHFCVHGFFIVSGYLISDSFLRMPVVSTFAVNRFLRIVPGLVVAIILSKLIANACSGFTHNPVPYIVNGPIWTLTWEVVCYLIVPLLGVIGALTSVAMSAVFVMVWLLYLGGSGGQSPAYVAIAPIVMMFSSGMFIRVSSERIEWNTVIGPMLLLLIFSYSPASSAPVLNFIRSNIVFLWGPPVAADLACMVAYLVALPFVVLYIGLKLPVLWMPKDDISYGIYIYGWPVAQTLVYLAMQHSMTLAPMLLCVLTIAATIPIAWLSWRIIERPALRLKVSNFRVRSGQDVKTFR